MLERRRERVTGVLAARLPVADVHGALASRSTGLTSAEVEDRRAESGPNVLPRVAGTSMARRFLANFTHVTALLLWAGGVVGFVAGMPQLGIAIWLVNVINGSFSFWQEYRAERAVEALARLLPARARVVRDGEDRQVEASEIVPLGSKGSGGTKMTHGDVQAWLDAYVEAWRTYDPDRIGALFAEGAEYRYHPWDEPIVGRDAIVTSWLAPSGGASPRDDPGTYDAHYAPIAVGDDVAVAAGTSTYFADASQAAVTEVFHNIFVLRFDGAGRCRAFTEYFVLQK